MTSISGQEMPSSEPESLDSLDYDDWEGQFEFIGNNSSAHIASPNPHEADDLNLSAVRSPTGGNAVVLIDEMTFLTMQTDDDHTSQSNYFNRKPMTDCVPFNGSNKLFSEKNSNSFVNSKEDHYVNFDDIINLKNKLNSDKNNNNSDHNGDSINGLNADLCDNLSEQVSICRRFRN